MTLSPGARLGPYEILAPLGAGGMGQVWRARDTRLGRDVAIKALPPEFSHDPERLARFEREARILASLSHPNIAGIYGVEEIEGARSLVLEFVEGETLAARLARGPMPLDDILEIGRQIAAGVEAAHESGLVHRDLKPGNIMITPSGTVKVLDFGLSKPSANISSPSLLNSPTVSYLPTVAGVILGTAAYMSPEQARGRNVDKRSDIWSFGCILYEMLTGKMLFLGDTVSDTIAAVLRADVDLTALPESTPEPLRHLVERCLDRDPSTRLRDIGEARLVLALPHGNAPSAAGRGEAKVATRPIRPWLAALIAVSLIGVGILGGRAMKHPAPAATLPALLFDVADTTNTLVNGSIALSPDGLHLVHSRRAADGSSSLFVRRLDRDDSQPLAGTRDGRFPFWSADGRSIGFFAGRTLLRVALDGGAANQIAVLPGYPMGGTWNAAGDILVGTDNGPIYRIQETGGTPQAITQVEQGVEEAHVWPAFFPDGESYVFLADASSDEGHRLTVRSLRGKESKVLRTNIRSAILVDPAGALLLLHQGQFVAWPFDFAKAEISGAQVILEDGMQVTGRRHELPITLSANGMMAFQGLSEATVITRIPLDGSKAEVLTTPDRYRNPRLFRDGRRIAYEIRPDTGERTIWAHDLALGSRTLVSGLGLLCDSPVWSVDGEWIYFGALSGTTWQVFRKRVLGGAPAEPLGAPPGTKDLNMLDASADGRWILLAPTLGDLGQDLYLGRIDGPSITWTPWVTTAAREQFGRFSPDSRWIAFQSDATGPDEIFVAPVEGGPAVRQWMVSVRGGVDPAWSPDGSRIYYRDPVGVLHAVPFTVVGDRLETRAPERLFPLPQPHVSYLRNLYDLTPDGKAIVAFVDTQSSSSSIRVRTGWRKW